MGLDVLASSLGMQEAQLLKMIRGQESQDYLVHISQRLATTNLPPGWLNQSNALIRPEFVNELRKLAAGAPNPGPLRRRNFQALVDAFEGSSAALADALDLVENSVMGIVQGRLPIDDERYNHLNPRLMEGGFPNGWLEDPEAKVDPAWLKKLESVANESYQLEEEERARDTAAKRASAGAEARRSAEPPAEPQVEPTAALSTVDTSPSANQVQQTLFALESSLQAGNPPPAESAHQPPALGAEASATATSKETPMASKQTPTVTVPSAPLKLPRGALSAGRGLPAAKPVVKTPKVHRAPAGTAMGKVTAHQAAAAPAAASSTPRDDTKVNTRGGKSPITREISLKRAAALEKLLETSRRGAKVTLWRDLLKSSLPYWGNIRRGSVMMRDEMAQDITGYMGLPEGWLDNATFPPATLAAWVTDPSAAIPASHSIPTTEQGASEDGQEAAAAPAAKKAGPFARKSAGPGVAILKSAPPAPQGVTLPKATRKAAAPAPVASAPAGVAQAAPAPVVAAPAPVTAQAPTPTLQVTAAAHAESAASVMPASPGTFSFVPERNAEPLVAVGPAVKAAIMVLNQMALDGRFTEQDGLRLVTALVTAH